MKSTPWARSSVGDEPHVTLESLQSGLTVGLIATNRADFATCTSNEVIANVVGRNRITRYDFLPVVEPGKDVADRNTIVGLIEIRPFMDVEPITGRVHEKMQSLSEQNLIGSDATCAARFVVDEVQ